jgi:hypothetical protein
LRVCRRPRRGRRRRGDAGPVSADARTDRALGYPAALVAQDGLEDLAVPWRDMDAMFIGGTTSWKLGPAAAGLAAQARRRGLWVHLGQVNSLRRMRYAQAIGCHSVDGTFLAFGPDRNLPTLLRWLGELHAPRVHAVSDLRGGAEADRVGHSPSGASSGSSTT